MLLAPASLLLTVAVSLVPGPSVGLPREPQPGTTWELQRWVEQCEREVDRARAELALLSSRLLRAHGREALELHDSAEEGTRALTVARCALAEARARWALAMGRRQQAVAELKTAIACHRAELTWVKDHAARFCNVAREIHEVNCRESAARVWLAETEGKPQALVGALQDLVGHRESDLRLARRLEQQRAIAPAEVRALEHEMAALRSRLEAARKQVKSGPPR
jgi:hypothetical protein